MVRSSLKKSRKKPNKQFSELCRLLRYDIVNGGQPKWLNFCHQSALHEMKPTASYFLAVINSDLPGEFQIPYQCWFRKVPQSSRINKTLLIVATIILQFNGNRGTRRGSPWTFSSTTRDSNRKFLIDGIQFGAQLVHSRKDTVEYTRGVALLAQVIKATLV